MPVGSGGESTTQLSLQEDTTDKVLPFTFTLQFTVQDTIIDDATYYVSAII